MSQRVAWQPLPGSQTLALSYGGSVLLYHGTRGPGKTDAQLMRFRMRVGTGYGRFWRGVIFDREYKNLDDLVSKSMRWYPNIADPANSPRFLSSKSDYRWVWPTGEELLFRTVKRPSDYWAYHGQEFPFIGWNELTKYPTDELYRSMMSCNRSSFRPQDYPVYRDSRLFKEHGVLAYVSEGHPYAEETYLPEIPLEVFATTNPYGPGHNWVKKEFILAAPMGKVVRTKVNVFNPQTQQREDVVRTRCHLFGSYRENKFLSPQYVAELESMTDKNKRKAWLGGSWDVVAGGMFDDVWDSDYNVIPPFRIPDHWVVERSFDYGSSAPFSVGWWAISDGSDVVLPNGKTLPTVRGDVFRFSEWYGTSGKPNEGLKLLASQITEGIIRRQLAMGMHHRVRPGAADSAIYASMDGSSIANAMAKPVTVDGTRYPGVQWRAANKAAGSRKSGWALMREYMLAAHPRYLKLPGVAKPVRLPRERPGLFVFNTCPHFQELVPILPRDEEDPDDVDTDAEDHIGDETRYFLSSHARSATVQTTKGT